jgi:hypothetical protein
MIPATVYQLLNAVQPQRREDGQVSSPLDVLLHTTAPADTAWKIRDIAGAIRAALARYEEIRIGLLEHYGQQGDDGSYVFTSSERQEAFTARYRELVNHTVSLPVEPLTRAQLAEVRLAAADLDALFFLLKAPPAGEFHPLAEFVLPELDAAAAAE